MFISSLRRRFLQNQEDCTFTLLALLPTLSAQIMEEMDVEDLTHQLQQLSSSKPKTADSSIAMGDSIVSLAGSESTSATESASSSDPDKLVHPSSSSTSSSAAQQDGSVPAPASTSSSGEEVEAEGEGEKTGEVGVGGAGEGRKEEGGEGSTQRDVGASWSSEFHEMENKGKDNLEESQQVSARP